MSLHFFEEIFAIKNISNFIVSLCSYIIFKIDYLKQKFFYGFCQILFNSYNL